MGSVGLRTVPTPGAVVGTVLAVRVVVTVVVRVVVTVVVRAGVRVAAVAGTAKGGEWLGHTGALKPQPDPPSTR